MPESEIFVDTGEFEEADVCLVGAGAAGGIVADRLSEGGLSVVVLEAGPDWPREAIKNDELELEKWLWPWPRKFRGSFPVLPLSGFGVGGTTRLYAGISIRNRPNDFVPKSARGFGTDWPIRYPDLLPYYQKVEKKIGVQGDKRSLAERPSASNPYPMGPSPAGPNGKILVRGAKALGLHPVPSPVAVNSVQYEKRPDCVQCGFCLLDCPSLAKGTTANTVMKEALARGITLRSDALALEIPVGPDGRAAGVLFVDLKDKRRYLQKARVVILCGGTVEVTRLLLNSKSPSFPNGLANSNDLVGRYLMGQNMGFVLGVFPEPVMAYKGMTSGIHVEDFYESDKRRGFRGGYTVHQFMFGPVWLAHMAPPFEENPATWGKELKNTLKQFERFAGVLYVGEEIPNPNNRIEVDPNTLDGFGLPVPVVTHEGSENDQKLRRHAEETCRNLLKAAGAQSTLTSLSMRHAAFQTLGTTRMGKDPGHSVVDEYGRTHEVENLYIAGGSVFPGSPPTFPTLTIQALALRTADRVVSGWKGTKRGKTEPK